VTTTAGPDSFALIIGAMKSGTTTLFEQLAQHPQIAPARVKEPHYFSEPDVFARGWDWYRGLWSWDPARHRVALEASTSYTTMPARPGVPARIAAVRGARFRFIYILRNPLTQIESNMRHQLFVEGERPLDQGVPPWMIETVSYAMQIDQYLAIFPRDSLLLLTLEEFEREPAAVLRRVCGFLGVDDAFRFQDPAQRFNAGSTFEMAPLWARIVKMPALRSLAGVLLSRRMRHFLREKVARLPGRQANLGRYQLTAQEQASVLRQLAPDLARLESEYGVPVGRDWPVPTHSVT
jgi:hypothetical protein